MTKVDSLVEDTRFKFLNYRTEELFGAITLAMYEAIVTF